MHFNSMFVLFLSLIIGFPRSLDGQGHELTKNPGSFAPGEPIGRGHEAQFIETNLNEILNVSTNASGESSGIRTISGELIPRAKDHATGNTPPKSTGTDISKNANPNPSSTVKAEQPQGAPDELTKNPGSFAPGEPIGRGHEAQFIETNLNEILNVSTNASGESSGIRTISGELIPRAKDLATGNTPPKSTGTDISKNANPNPSSTVKAEQPQGAPDKPPINTNQGQTLVPGTPLGPNTGEALGSMSPGEPLGPNGHFVHGEPIGSGQVAKFKEVNFNEIRNPGPKGSGGIRTVSGELIPRPIDQPTGNVPPKSTGPNTFNTPSIGVSVGSADKTTT